MALSQGAPDASAARALATQFVTKLAQNLKHKKPPAGHPVAPALKTGGRLRNAWQRLKDGLTQLHTRHSTTEHPPADTAASWHKPWKHPTKLHQKIAHTKLRLQHATDDEQRADLESKVSRMETWAGILSKVQQYRGVKPSLIRAQERSAAGPAALSSQNGNKSNAKAPLALDRTGPPTRAAGSASSELKQNHMRGSHIGRHKGKHHMGQIAANMYRGSRYYGTGKHLKAIDSLKTSSTATSLVAPSSSKKAAARKPCPCKHKGKHHMGQTVTAGSGAGSAKKNSAELDGEEDDWCVLNGMVFVLTAAALCAWRYQRAGAEQHVAQMVDVSGVEEGLMLGQPRTAEKELHVTLAVEPMEAGITKSPDASDVKKLVAAQI